MVIKRVAPVSKTFHPLKTLFTPLFTGGARVAQSIEHLPSAQAMISGSWDRALRGVPCLADSLLLPLPLPPVPLLVLVLSLRAKKIVF